MLCSLNPSFQALGVPEVLKAREIFLFTGEFSILFQVLTQMKNLGFSVTTPPT